jgi:hypothetical protein
MDTRGTAGKAAHIGNLTGIELDLRHGAVHVEHAKPPRARIIVPVVCDTMAEFGWLWRSSARQTESSPSMHQAVV